MDRLNRETALCLILAVFIGLQFTYCLPVCFALDPSSESIDDVAKLVNESEKKKLEVARVLKENKKAYDLLEKELADERRAASEDLIRLHRTIAFRRLLIQQKIAGDKIWWNAEMALRFAIEESLRRQTACAIQMAELERLEKLMERNLREMVDAEISFRKNLNRLIAVSKEILRRRALEKKDTEREEESLGRFFQNRSNEQLSKTADVSGSASSRPVDSGVKKKHISRRNLISPVEEGIVETGSELKKGADSMPLVYSKGVLIKAKDGMPVRAVADGHVVYSGWFREFGRTVIIDHGDHYFSVMAYLGSVKVNEGDSVKQGDIIGEVSHSEILGESGIYFEWRHNGKPLDVKQWFALKSIDKKGD